MGVGANDHVSAPWFMVGGDATAASDRIEFEPPGSFVVRDVGGGNYELSYTQRQQVKRCTIASSGGSFYVDDGRDGSFPTLSALVDHCMKTVVPGIGVQLIAPRPTDIIRQTRQRKLSQKNCERVLLLRPSRLTRAPQRPTGGTCLSPTARRP